MKILLLILFTPLTLLGQDVVFASDDEPNPYKSTEENIYNKENKYKPFKPLPIDIIKNHSLKHIKIQVVESSAHQDVNESTLSKMERDITFLDPKNLTSRSKKRDALLRYKNSKGAIVTLYLDSKYDEFMWGEPGYWINIEDESGSKDYYTGLAQNYYIKFQDTGVNIWKNDSTLQISGIRVRLIQPFMHPIEAAKYEAIDNVKVEISISDLKRDSDNDGLTDIEEDKLMLNPNSNDTDGDGIADPEDHNPRFKSETTHENLIYKGILDEFINDTIRIRDKKIMKPERPSLIHTLLPRTRLIVTEDVNLQTVDFDYNWNIIMTKNEYLAFKIKYPVTFDETQVTPLFKVDNMTDTFVISEYRDLGGDKYVVKKLKNGYDIRGIEHWIH